MAIKFNSDKFLTFVMQQYRKNASVKSYGTHKVITVYKGFNILKGFHLERNFINILIESRQIKNKSMGTIWFKHSENS